MNTLEVFKIEHLPTDEDTVSDLIQLLEDCDLPTSDVNTEKIIFFRAVKGSRMVGVVGAEPRGAHVLLRSLAVDEQYRSRGVGSLLVNHLLVYCQDEWIDGVYLLTTTAKDFFAAHGFSIVDRAEVPESIRLSSEFSTLCPLSAIVMYKEL